MVVFLSPVDPPRVVWVAAYAAITTGRPLCGIYRNGRTRVSFNVLPRNHSEGVRFLAETKGESKLENKYNLAFQTVFP
jgi:hypothetical protein